MRFSYPAVDHVFSTEGNKVNCLVIENRKLYSELISDVFDQTEGLKGQSTLYSEGKLLDFSKYVDLTSSFFPFEIGRKSLLSKITSVLEKKALEADEFEKTAGLLASIENYMNELSVDLPCDLVYNRISISSIIKAAGIDIVDDSESLPERFLNYMELVREFDSEKLFITVNFRSFAEDGITDSFLESVIAHKYNLLMLESTSYPVLKNEIRVTVDEDLCLI